MGLLRLSVKTLSKFSRVCRSRHTLISDPIFRKSQHDRSVRNPALLVCASVQDFENDRLFLNFSTFDKDGILLKRFVKEGLGYRPAVVSTCQDFVFLMDDWYIFLVNHATEELITLPSISNGYYSAVGFGYVPSTKEFKVVACKSDSGWKVLTLGMDHWREVANPPFDVHGDGNFLNGSVYLQPHSDSDNDDDDRIASFNLEREEWGAVVTRPPVHSMYRAALKKLGGFLCMTELDIDDENLSIWLLKDYKKGNCVWVKEYIICISPLNAQHPRMVSPLAIEDDGRVLLAVDSSSLQLYDPQTKGFREIQRFEQIECTRKVYFKRFSSLGSN